MYSLLQRQWILAWVWHSQLVPGIIATMQIRSHKFWLSQSLEEVQDMGKHVYPAFVLVCTLSTHVEGNERTLPGQETSIKLNKKLPGIF